VEGVEETYIVVCEGESGAVERPDSRFLQKVETWSSGRDVIHIQYKDRPLRNQIPSLRM
jgi:hypothetical protein